jgi:large subunit ribosomal protein L18e
VRGFENPGGKILRIWKSLPPHKSNKFKKMKRTGATNPLLQNLIHELKRKSNEQSVNLWKRIALELERPTRQRRAINLSRINRHTRDDEIIVVPGKVLGSGILNHKLTISAYSFSQQAKDKIEKSGAKIIPLLELIKENPNGKKIKIIG